MKVENTRLKDVFIITPEIFGDDRGFFLESWNSKNFRSAGLDINFVQDNTSRSSKGILRGLHFQTKNPQGKYVTVLKGKIFDVAVDLRKNSKTFGKHFSCILSEFNFKSVYIPPGFAHGFMTLEKENYVLYGCTKYRSAKSEKSIKFNDKNLNIRWPFKKPILSKRDKNAMDFKEYKNKNL